MKHWKFWRDHAADFCDRAWRIISYEREACAGIVRQTVERAASEDQLVFVRQMLIDSMKSRAF